MILSSKPSFSPPTTAPWRPKGKHTMTLGVQQLPFELAGTDWDTIRDEWADKVLEVLFRYAPNLREHILERSHHHAKGPRT